MGLITPEHDNYFKPASIVYSKVKRDLESYDAVNLIDEGEFPQYINDVLRFLGLGIYREKDAIMQVKDYKARMPKDFSKLYAAYKCTPFIESQDFVSLQGQPVSVYNDVTWELLEGGVNADIETINDDRRITEKITVRQYVKETPIALHFKNPILLSLSPNVHRDKCADDCHNILCTNVDEITIGDGYIYTNFTHDHIYMKYYAFPQDENGVPMILASERVEKAVEFCIKFNLLYKWWINDSVPNLQNKWQEAEQRYNYWLAEAKSELQMPYFSQMVNNIRRNRAINKLVVFTPRYNGSTR